MSRAPWSAARDGRRCPWAAMAVTDRLWTLLADDAAAAGDKARAERHIDARDAQRRGVDALASAWCGRPVTGYADPP